MTTIQTGERVYRWNSEDDKGNLRDNLAMVFNRLGIGGYYHDDPFGLADEVLAYLEEDE